MRHFREIFAGFSTRFPTGILQIAVIVGLIVSAVIYARAPSKAEAALNSGIETASRKNQNAMPLVSIVQPRVSTNLVSLTSTGSITVRNSIDLVPQVTGRITWVADAFRRGGYFRANEELVRLEKRDFELAVAQASADIDSARSNLELAKATSNAAISNYSLLHPGKPVPPLVAKLPQIAQAKAQVAAAAARREIAKLDLSRTVFSLPFDGRVVESKAEVGQLLNQGQSFGDVFALDSIEALVPVSPSELDLISPALGRAGQLLVGNRQYKASIARVSPDLDERTRFAQLYFKIEDNADLYPGAFIDVEIEGPRLTNTLLIPEAAEQTNESIWSVVKGKLVRAKPKFLNRNSRGIVTEAFEIGEGIVLGTVPGAFEGLKVDIEIVDSG